MNALGKLRERLGYTAAEIAARLQISLEDLETLESTPLRLLEVSSVSLHLGACECRLDLVAVHIDGESVFLGDEEASS